MATACFVHSDIQGWIKTICKVGDRRPCFRCTGFCLYPLRYDSVNYSSVSKMYPDSGNLFIPITCDFLPVAIVRIIIQDLLSDGQSTSIELSPATSSRTDQSVSLSLLSTCAAQHEVQRELMKALRYMGSQVPLSNRRSDFHWFPEF